MSQNIISENYASDAFDDIFSENFFSENHVSENDIYEICDSENDIPGLEGSENEISKNYYSESSASENYGSKSDNSENNDTSRDISELYDYQVDASEKKSDSYQGKLEKPIIDEPAKRLREQFLKSLSGQSHEKPKPLIPTPSFRVVESENFSSENDFSKNHASENDISANNGSEDDTHIIQVRKFKKHLGSVIYYCRHIFCSSHFPFLVFGHFLGQSYKNTKVLRNICLHFALQYGQDRKKQNENHATKVTKIPKTKGQKYGMNETKVCAFLAS